MRPAAKPAFDHEGAAVRQQKTSSTVEYFRLEDDFPPSANVLSALM
jgi:hypothetical protein